MVVGIKVASMLLTRLRSSIFGLFAPYEIRASDPAGITPPRDLNSNLQRGTSVRFLSTGIQIASVDSSPLLVLGKAESAVIRKGVVC